MRLCAKFISLNRPLFRAALILRNFEYLFRISRMNPLSVQFICRLKNNHVGCSFMPQHVCGFFVKRIVLKRRVGVMKTGIATLHIARTR
jgi:hypothetical protein